MPFLFLFPGTHLFSSFRTWFRCHLPGRLPCTSPAAHTRLRCCNCQEHEHGILHSIVNICLPHLFPTVYGQGWGLTHLGVPHFKSSLHIIAPQQTLGLLPFLNKLGQSHTARKAVKPCVNWRLNLKLMLHTMPCYSPTWTEATVLADDLDVVHENETGTDLCSDRWPSKQGLVCRGSNRQSPLHQSSGNAAPMVVVPAEENCIISLKKHKPLPSYKIILSSHP